MTNARMVPLALLAALLASRSAGATTKMYEILEPAFSISLPTPCRHEMGPGTLEAICAVDLDVEKGKEIQAAASILLEVDFEVTPPDAKAFTETEFRQELPESVCGEGDTKRVRLEDVKATTDGDRTTFFARVICPELRFLGLGERHAEARTVITPKSRFRLMARYPAEDVDMAKPLAKAFFESFKAKSAP